MRTLSPIAALPARAQTGVHRHVLVRVDELTGSNRPRATLAAALGAGCHGGRRATDPDVALGALEVATERGALREGEHHGPEPGDHEADAGLGIGIARVRVRDDLQVADAG